MGFRICALLQEFVIAHSAETFRMVSCARSCRSSVPASSPSAISHTTPRFAGFSNGSRSSSLTETCATRWFDDALGREKGPTCGFPKAGKSPRRPGQDGVLPRKTSANTTWTHQDDVRLVRRTGRLRFSFEALQGDFALADKTKRFGASSISSTFGRPPWNRPAFSEVAWQGDVDLLGEAHRSKGFLVRPRGAILQAVWRGRVGGRLGGTAAQRHE